MTLAAGTRQRPRTKRPLNRSRKGPISYGILAVTALVTLVPFLYAAVNSLRTTGQISADPLGLPSPVVWSNDTDLLVRTVVRIGPADWRIHESVQLPPGADDLLRVVVVLELDDRYEQVEWFGPGPWENYPDRSRSAPLGRWTSSVDDLETGHVRQQENGGRGGVHEVRLVDPEGRSVTTRRPTAVQSSAAHHTVADLEATSHDWLLPRRDATYLHLDTRHRGVGTAFLGPDTPVRYRVPGGVHAWTWRLTLEG